MATILVVDDEPGVLAAWDKALRYAGHQVQLAANPDAALTLCDTHHFDVAVVDFLMPQMTGLELLHRLRKRHALIRSIIVSGKIDENVTETTITDALSAGLEVDLYLHKPVSNDRLIEAIKGLVERPLPQDWAAIAKKTVAAEKATLKKTEDLVKQLRSMKKKSKKKK